MLRVKDVFINELYDEGPISMKTVTRLIHASLLIAGTLSASTAMACTTSLWDGGTTGTTIAGSPEEDVSRVSGLCALELTDAPGTVKDNSPTAETAANIRFYVKAELTSGSPVIFEAFNAASDSLIAVGFDGTGFTFNAGDDTSPSVSAEVGKWNLVELAWTDGGSLEYWVNSDATQVDSQGSVNAISGTMDSVVLGTNDGFTGTLTFDDYEAHRSTPVGGLLIGDSNGNGSINVFDLISIQNEILGNGLAVGQPDCNLNGSVNVFDLICSQNIILGN